MQLRSIRGLTAAAFTVGGALTVLGNFPDRLSKYVDIQAFWYDIVLIAGLLLIVLAGALFLYARVPRLRVTTYGISAVSEARLRKMYGFIKTVLGEDVAPFETFRAWHSKNRNIVQAVTQTTDGAFGVRQDLVGFFSVFPVTERAKKLLETNELVGTALAAQHTCSEAEIPTAYYIGAVGGVGVRGRAVTHQQLIGFMAALLRRHSRLVFTRPMTEDGIRLASDYHFSAVSRNVDEPKNAIYVRDFEREPMVF